MCFYGGKNQFSAVLKINFHSGKNQEDWTVLPRSFHWRQNLFKIPSGRVGTLFVYEISHMFQVYAESSALEWIAMKAAMTQLALLLQKPHLRSITKERVKHLECRLGFWKEGNLDSLLDEGKMIQSCLARESSSWNTPADEFSGRFSKVMMEGTEVQPLHLDSIIDSENPSESVLDTLLKKHPAKKPRHSS